MNQSEMLRLVEQFSQNDGVVEGPMKMIRVPDSKTVYVETIGEIGRSIFLTSTKWVRRSTGLATARAATRCISV